MAHNRMYHSPATCTNKHHGNISSRVAPAFSVGTTGCGVCFNVLPSVGLKCTAWTLVHHWQRAAKQGSCACPLRDASHVCQLACAAAMSTTPQQGTAPVILQGRLAWLLQTPTADQSPGDYLMQVNLAAFAGRFCPYAGSATALLDVHILQVIQCALVSLHIQQQGSHCVPGPSPHGVPEGHKQSDRNMCPVAEHLSMYQFASPDSIMPSY